MYMVVEKWSSIHLRNDLVKTDEDPGRECVKLYMTTEAAPEGALVSEAYSDFRKLTDIGDIS